MVKETLKYILSQPMGEKMNAVKPRELELPLDSGKVVTLMGTFVRRLHDNEMGGI